MLHPESHGKCLGLHGYLFLLQHFKGIPGAVADGQHHLLRRENLSSGTFYAGDPALIQKQLGHFGVEMDITAPGKDLLPHIPDHLGQNIRADMWFVFIQNTRRRAMLHKNPQDLAASALFILNKRIQLAVGKGSRTAFTELHIGIRPAWAACPECFHIPGTGLHVAAPF